jgi:O-antigen ligase
MPSTPHPHDDSRAATDAVRLRWPQRPVAGVAVASVLVAYPALLLLVRGAAGAAQLVLALGGVAMLLGLPAARMPPAQRAAVRAWVTAMLGVLAATLLSQAVHGSWVWRHDDAPARFMLAIPVYCALRRVELRRLAALQYGLIAGALLIALGLVVAPHRDPFGRVSTGFIDLITFGDTALLLGVLAALSIGWLGPEPRWRLVLKLAALVAGLYASVVSGSRGGWLALPLFLAIGLLGGRRRSDWRRLGWIAGGALVLAALAYWLLPEIHQRIDLVLSDLRAFRGGDPDTSVGIRLQLWRAALHLWAHQPWFGLGPGGFKAAMTSMQHAGWLTPLAAQYGRGEVHNEILDKTCALGVPGLIAILALYLVPATIFARRLRGAAAVPARMGLALTLGFMVFGLTVETFDLKMNAAFYALSGAVLLAATLRPAHEP